eukprot:scaffold69979_cov69-Attheya_sp.AAC.1
MLRSIVYNRGSRRPFRNSFHHVIHILNNKYFLAKVFGSHPKSVYQRPWPSRTVVADLYDMVEAVSKGASSRPPIVYYRHTHDQLIRNAIRIQTD